MQEGWFSEEFRQNKGIVKETQWGHFASLSKVSVLRCYQEGSVLESFAVHPPWPLTLRETRA